MKKFLFIALTFTLLGSVKVNAQTECPDIEWMRFFNNNDNFINTIFHIDNSKNEFVSGYYGGSPIFGNIPLPMAQAFTPNAFMAKTDSSGSPLWIKVVKFINYSNSYFFANPVTDSVGNIYTAINFNGAVEFDDTTYTAASSGAAAMLIKLSPQGQILSTHLIEGLTILTLQIDNHLNWYIGTNFTNTATIGNQNYTSNGSTDILLFKFSRQYQLLWAKQIGGDGPDLIINSYPEYHYLQPLKIDDQDNVYLTGNFSSSSITLGNIQITKPAQSLLDIFVTKLDSSGNFDWAFNSKIQGSGSSGSTASIALDKHGNVYITGYLAGTFKPGNNPISSFPTNVRNTFLMRYNPGSQQFNTLLFKGGWNRGRSLLYLHNKDELLLSGLIASDTPVDFYIDSLSTNNGNPDFYVVSLKTDTIANTWIPSWIVHSSGNGSVDIPAMVADNNEHIYLSGQYSGADLNTFGNNTFPTISGSGFTNGFQAKLAFLNREVTVNNGTLTAVQNNALYQWLDCSNGMQAIPGATNQSFSPAQPGNYAVRVSNSLCSVVSDCINTTGITENQLLQQIEVYPNPVQQQLNFSHLPLGTQVTVYDVLGRVVYSGISEKESLQINTRQWVAGLYMVALSKNGGKKMVKVLKE